MNLFNNKLFLSKPMQRTSPDASLSRLHARLAASHTLWSDVCIAKRDELRQHRNVLSDLQRQSTNAIVKRYKRLLARTRCARVHLITVQYVGFAALIP